MIDIKIYSKAICSAIRVALATTINSLQWFLTPSRNLLFVLLLISASNILISQSISTEDALNRPADQITIVTGETYEDNTGSFEHTYDARDWSTKTTDIYPVKIGHNVPGTRQVWVGGQVIGPQNPHITWVDMKADYDGTAILIKSNDYLVVDGLRTINVMDAVRPRGNTSTFRISNVYAAYIHDDAIENDNMMGGLVDDCFFDGCFVFLSQQSNMGSTLTWSTTDSLEIKNTLARLQPMAYSVSNSGRHPDFESFYGVNADRHGQLFKHHGPGDAPLNVHDCIFYVPQYSTNGINAMDFPDFEGCKYSNIVLLWTGGGYYPGELPPSGVTEYNLSNSNQEIIDQIWADSVDSWISRHGYDVLPFKLTVNSGGGDGEYIVGSEVTIQAETLNTGEEFEKWTGDTIFVANEYDSVTTVKMPLADISLTATYKNRKYKLTVNNGSGGGNYITGWEVNILADTPVAGKEFEKWTGDIEYIADEYDSITTVIMPDADISLTANYKDRKYKLTVNNGSGDGEYFSGSEVNILADASADGQAFEKWTGDDENAANPYDSATTVVMPTANVTLTATYRDVGTGITSSFYKPIIFFPNPANEKIIVENIPVNGEIIISSLNGNMIRSYHPISDKLILDIHELNKGFYVAIIKSREKTQTNKLIIY